MKYPYIGKCITGTVLFSSTGVGAVIKKEHRAWGGIVKFEFSDGWDELDFKNITREYLSNTWGVVESKEHAEFIIELAELHGFKLSGDSSRLGSFFSFSFSGFGFLDFEFIARHDSKQVTIPLPSKAVKNEWPQVGDEVLIDISNCDVVYGQNLDGLICKVSSIFKDGDTTVYAVNRDGVNYCFTRGVLKKPKTPEDELRDELMIMATQAMHNSDFDTDHNCYYLISGLMKKYNITKKDKGDE